jgi:hypothetical protein
MRYQRHESERKEQRPGDARPRPNTSQQPEKRPQRNNEQNREVGYAARAIAPVPFRVTSGPHTMCTPVVLVGGVSGGLFKVAGRGLVRLVMCAQGPVAQQQRDHEYQR